MARNGYHPNVYNKPVNGDKLVAELCAALMITDVTKYSLEMQIWWRDHQAADRERIAREKRDLKDARTKQQPL